ncbi:MAG: TolC family protein [Ignavibacteriales bacterium]|nr:TolC family protein [Ignavibacteriales bacterium]
MKSKMIVILLTLSMQIFAQSETLENYVRYGLENNLALKQKQFNLEKSLSSLQEAQGMFFPSFEVNARYSRAGGGREIIFPVGNLVNPIHSALNYLLQQNLFPTNIQNEIIPFLRKEEQETKISLVQPLFQPAIFYNYNIQDKILEISQLDKKVFARSLVDQIKNSYFNYLKCKGVEEIYESSLELVNENLRVCESLQKNDKITIDIVYRAKAEVSEMEQKLMEAKNSSELAASYFNFLLNNPLEREIIIDTTIVWQTVISDLNQTCLNAIEKREEILQLEYMAEIYKDKKSMANSNYFPTLVFAADYGFQGEQYRFTDKDDYWMASLVLHWNLFNGFQDVSKSEQAELEKKKVEVQMEELKKQISLQVINSYKNYELSQKSLISAKEMLASMKISFRIIEKKYIEGIASYIEYLDSRNKLLQSEINEVVSKYDYQQKISELEKMAAFIDLKNYE